MLQGAFTRRHRTQRRRLPTLLLATKSERQRYKTRMLTSWQRDVRESSLYFHSSVNHGGHNVEVRAKVPQSQRQRGHRGPATTAWR